MDFCVSHFRTEDEVQLYPLLLSPSPLLLLPTNAWACRGKVGS